MKINPKKINEILDNKGKDLLGEAFEGMNAVVSTPVINKMYVITEKMNEGPAYEYAAEVKKIEKLKALHDKELGILIKKIAKQDKKAAKELGRKYNNVDREYDHYFVAGLEDILLKLG